MEIKKILKKVVIVIIILFFVTGVVTFILAKSNHKPIDKKYIGFWSSKQKELMISKNGTCTYILKEESLSADVYRNLIVEIDEKNNFLILYWLPPFFSFEKFKINNYPKKSSDTDSTIYMILDDRKYIKSTDSLYN